MGSHWPSYRWSLSTWNDKKTECNQVQEYKPDIISCEYRTEPEETTVTESHAITDILFIKPLNGQEDNQK